LVLKVLDAKKIFFRGNLRVSFLGIKVYMFLFFDNLGSYLNKEDLKLKDILILFDRDSGVSIFQDIRGYDDPIDDAEWILERNPKTRGFIIRPISQGEKDGLWIGEYVQNGNAITRYQVLFDRGAHEIGGSITSYAQRKITERALIEKMNINSLKQRLGSEIVRSFKYYECPFDQFYYVCREVKRIYEILKEKYDEKKVPYSNVADEILVISECSEAVICPLRAPNAFGRIYNLDRALKSRGLGEIRFISPGIVQIA